MPKDTGTPSVNSNSKTLPSNKNTGHQPPAPSTAEREQEAPKKDGKAKTEKGNQEIRLWSSDVLSSAAKVEACTSKMNKIFEKLVDLEMKLHVKEVESHNLYHPITNELTEQLYEVRERSVASLERLFNEQQEWFGDQDQIPPDEEKDSTDCTPDDIIASLERMVIQVKGSLIEDKEGEDSSDTGITEELQQQIPRQSQEELS